MTNYFTSICPYESRKCGKEGKKSQKIEYLDKEKSFCDEIRTCFCNFQGLSFGKNKNLKKIVDASFKS